jgi:uncharacterized protein
MPIARERDMLPSVPMLSIHNGRGVVWFLLIAFSLAWLLDLSIWLSGQGLASPWALLILVRNFTPLIATIVVLRVVAPVSHTRATVGLRRGAPGVPWLAYWLVALLGMTLLNIASAFVGALLGRFPLDLGLSLARAAAQASPEGVALLAQIGAPTYVSVVLLTLPIQALLLIPLALGEELGWRGFLLPNMVPLGERRALATTGAIWGLWHAPLIPLGLNYPGHPWQGIVLMIGVGVIFGSLLGWMRLASGSVWPAVLGHAAFNANQVLGGIVLLAREGAAIDTTQATLLGWTGWILPLVVIGVLWGRSVSRRRLVASSSPTPTSALSEQIG